MIVQFGKNKIDVDVEKTREYYKTEPLVNESCSCEYCRNYILAEEKFSDKIKLFFEKLGIDPRKIQEVYSADEHENGFCVYGGFTPFCGAIIEGGEKTIEKTHKDGSKSYKRSNENEFEVEENFCVDFIDEMIIEDDSFPRPVCSLIFSFKIPWLLPEPKLVDYSEISLIDENELVFSNGERISFSNCLGSWFEGGNIFSLINKSSDLPYFDFCLRDSTVRIIFKSKGIFSRIRAQKLFRKFKEHMSKKGFNLGI